MEKRVLAFDFGASSGRAIIGHFDGENIRLEEVHRFSNDPVSVNGTLYWDVLRLFFEIKQGLTKAKLAGGFDSIGIDTWGVDFGLLDEFGCLLENPIHYRDARTAGMIEEVFKTVPREELYSRTGIQFMELNTLFQLCALKKYRPHILDRTDKMLFMPDLFAYMLTGRKQTEYSIATTSQMVDIKTKDWAYDILDRLGIDAVDGMLFDLGVSSPQLDDAARGCSYKQDAPLDMRMSQQGETAADLVNTESREELARILRDYGEEPYAWQIAGKIVEARETAPILTTLQLADIVASAMPPAERRKNKNPSRRTFQALRIAVNHELDALEEGLDTIFDHLAPGGRLCVITFHSLEDRLVKNKFRRWSTACTCPPEFPVCVCGGKAKAKLITRKPIEADTQELEENRRSRSAHLRVLEKC